MMLLRACRVALLAIAATAPIASASGIGDLERAQQSYDRGVEAKATKPAEARAAFGESAALLRQVVSDGADNAGVHFNLGNAYVQSGDIGRGIASYLRAQRLAPYDRAIAANLATARTDIATKIGGDAVSDGSRIAWWRVVGEGPRLWTAIVAWTACWVLVAWPLITGSLGSRALRAVRAAGLVVALLSGATVGIDRWLAATRPLAVVIAGDVVVRKGNGDGFEAQVAEKLNPGVECMVLESRPGWLRVRLADGTEGWVREEQVERV